MKAPDDIYVAQGSHLYASYRMRTARALRSQILRAETALSAPFGAREDTSLGPLSSRKDL